MALQNSVRTQLGTKLSCSFVLSLFKELMAFGTRRVRQTRCGGGQNLCQVPEPPLEQVQSCLAEEQREKWKGTGQGQLAPSGAHTEQASVWTVCFWCHGNLQKELHNSTTFLEGLHELKYCYTMTTSPKIGSSSTRSSTNAILKWLKLSPQNCKQAAPSTRNTDLFNIPPV